MKVEGNEFVADNVVYGDNSGSKTASVGSRLGGMSWVGAYDLSGNVWEWVSSIYKAYPYDGSDGRESNIDTNSNRVLRVTRGAIHTAIYVLPVVAGSILVSGTASLVFDVPTRNSSVFLREYSGRFGQIALEAHLCSAGQYAGSPHAGTGVGAGHWLNRLLALPR